MRNRLTILLTVSAVACSIISRDAPAQTAGPTPGAPAARPTPAVQTSPADDPDYVAFQPSSRVAVIENETFATHRETTLKLDLYRPTAAAPGGHPAVIVVPGGGWTGDRKDVVNLCGALAQRGVAAACIDHRSMRQTGFPAPIEDARAALRWLYDNAERFDIDQKRISIFGTSSGAQVALITALSDVARDRESRFSFPRIAAVVGFAAPTDLRTLPPGNLRSAGRYLRAAPGDSRHLWSQASAVDHVDANDPPILLIQGEGDTAVPMAQVTAFKDRGRQLGAAVELVILSDGPHPFWHYRPWHQPAIDRAADFLHRHRAP